MHTPLHLPLLPLLLVLRTAFALPQQPPSPTSPAQPLSAFPPFTTNAPSTQTHIQIHVSTSPHYPKWNNHPLFDFLNTLQSKVRTNARIARDLGKRGVVPQEFVFSLGEAENWQWRFEQVRATEGSEREGIKGGNGGEGDKGGDGKDAATWADLLSVTSVLFTDMRRFYLGGMGYRTVEILVGRMGKAEERPLGRIVLWWGSLGDENGGGGEGAAVS